MSAVSSDEESVFVRAPILGPQTHKQRKRSSVHMDAIHEPLDPTQISPAQLYLTESGHLFHAGKVAIVLVGLPARGKTHLAVSLTRYLRWLGVKTHAFHLGDYRRAQFPDHETQTGKADAESLPSDYFDLNPSEKTKKLRSQIVDACLADMDVFFDKHNGQVAIYDAVNPTYQIRQDLVDKLTTRSERQVLFVESYCTDDSLVARNIRGVKISSPDYQGWSYEEAVKHYLKRIELRIPYYQSMNREKEAHLSYVKLINVSEKMILNNTAHLGYLVNRIVFFLMNARIKTGNVYFARAGEPVVDPKNYKMAMDLPLSEEGKQYAETLCQIVLNHISDYKLHQQQKEESAANDPDSRRIGQDIDAKLATQPNPHRNTATTSRHGSRRGSKHGSRAASGTTSPAFASSSSVVSMNNLLSDSPTGSTTSSTSKMLVPSAVSTSKMTNLVVWTSVRARTVETAAPFSSRGIPFLERGQLTQLNPGVCENMTEEEIKEKYPEEWDKHQKDPYHHRFPRSESYHDLAVRLEPLILEMERIPGDIVIVAHESVLRVLYGYLMACTVQDIPTLSFPRNEIVCIIPNAYHNQVERIPVPGVEA
ncbi:6-phosphofructo-2-kinase-domain-containing protein [Yarrowia lipolytica]|jgi:6-phosphofructo-2-kinase/fructose-2,6-biphosphatase 4|uniref:YALI0D21010p n=2 Tax=Yarrowia lipolytica TaxID=4952 RepID=Q6C8B6_YARLI|nr:YALI0D21010p [Yarrowia lipolytica CLIB122]AOW04395.1 hypothetical protein YALI1_D26610g [Yarrowia lipolytica]KAB8285781.1 6-phosphofructo-2-kinase-domain-containing protein [Yarrowia lipolytica]KAE8171876.1 6-phosphofructo-2-kinase-domain-containing protein [Yarrowia lipolytica]KAJ8054122.1 6-phosphofructo-2-kinase-domain-containing protein [Yarrowia lipolytica]QNP98003.1 Hypothetical protein YALI2_D00444g [Yarrowia lipolytica]|eukprot:XP_503096.1 YALI0D21010p [Yarrowia lipolytica CLIB122]